MKSGGIVLAAKLPGFAGLVGREVQPDRRLGTEFSDYAKFWGRVGGILHTDELPKYGISDTEVTNLRKHVGASDKDAIVIVAALKAECEDALQAVLERAREAVKGVPTETRTPLPDGTTKYARPRPGAERMYPETDVRPVKITDSWLRRIKKAMPETLAEKERRFVKELGLSTDLAGQMTNSLSLDLFEYVLSKLKISPTLVAVTLENTLVSMQRDGVPIENIGDAKLLEVFEAVTRNETSSEALPEILSYLANNPSTPIQEALSKTGLGKIETEDIEKIIRSIVEDRLDFVRERGQAAVGGLMGVAMKELRGKADGKLVKELLTSEVKRVLGQ